MVIENACFDAPWAESYFRLALQYPRPYEHFYLARRAQHIVGYIVFSIIAGDGHILNLAVPPAHRRQGIAKYLIAAALERIAAADGLAVFLEVAVSNLPAQMLYRRFGFRICGIRKNYYGRSKDAYVFRKGVNRDAT